MDVRPYREDDAAALWELKRAFELELGAGGGDEKATRYAGKLTDDYRERYLAWVERCVEREPGCVVVAAASDGLAGYAFLLPADHAMIWDAAVLNEIFVREPERGTGVADALFEVALDHAREQDLPLDRLVLDVDRGNDRARSFYRRHGFSEWGLMVARGL